MPMIGPLEFVMIAAIALIVFGPQKLPEIARTVGRFLQQMRQMASEVKSEFETGLDGPDDEVADEDAEAIEKAAAPEGAEAEATPTPDDEEGGS